jgi:hypothetical protein
VFITTGSGVGELPRRGAGYGPQITLPAGPPIDRFTSNYPEGLAVDSAGDLFIAYASTKRANNLVLELPRTTTGYGPQTTLPFSGLNSPSGVGVDSAGDVFVADVSYDTFDFCRVLELPRTTTGYGPQSMLPFSDLGSSLNGIAADNAGDVFVIESGRSDVVELHTVIPAAPVFSLPPGVYTGPQTVSITYPVAGAALYYTTDGTVPSASSTPYTGPVSVTSTKRLTAIAIAGGAPSAIGTAAYTIASSTPANAFNFGEGFAHAQGSIQFNGGTDLDGTRLQLTSGAIPGEPPGSAFYAIPVNVQSFTTDFTFQLIGIVDPAADGITFTIQNVSATALGVAGEGLGYEGIGKSVAIKFDLYSNAGEGPNSTGLYTDGALPTVPAINLTGTSIDLHSGDPITGDPFTAQITYDGTTLILTLTDTVTLATWSHSFAIDIPATVGGNTAYIGFTGATGGQTADQEILSWMYISGLPGAQPPALAAPALPTYAGGFNAAGLVTNGSASLSGTTLQLTADGGLGVVRGGDASAFYAAPVNIQSFTTDFTFLLSSSFFYSLSNLADGITFTIQNDGATALGVAGGGLGYEGIGKSVAIKFDLHNNAGEGPNSTGLYTDGALPTVPAINLTGTGIDLHSGDAFTAHIAYNGTDLVLTLTDTVTSAAWSHSFPIDIPATVGGKTAFAGFTASTGYETAVQQVLNWTFTNP